MNYNSNKITTNRLKYNNKITTINFNTPYINFKRKYLLKVILH